MPIRTAIGIPITIAAVAALGCTLCSVLGFNAHYREMGFALIASLIAAELGIVPLFFTRGATQPAVAQASLAGSVLHLLSGIGIAGAMMLYKPLGLDKPFIYWLLAFYWLTLVVLVATFIHAVKVAPVESAAAKPRQG